MKIEPKVLENPFVRLEPIGEPHREGLRAACNADQDVWTRLYPYSWAGEHFDPTWAKLIDDNARGGTQGYAVIVGGEVVGLTTFYGVDPANAVLEVGGTYYRPDVRGGVVNPAAAMPFPAGGQGFAVALAAFIAAENLRSGGGIGESLNNKGAESALAVDQGVVEVKQDSVAHGKP